MSAVIQTRLGPAHGAPALATVAGSVTQVRVVRAEWTKLRALRSTWWCALLAVVLLTDNNRFSLAEESVTAGLTAAVLVVVLILLLLAARVQRYLGAAGIMVITQIMGLVLAAYSVQQVLDGVVKVFGRAGH